MVWGDRSVIVDLQNFWTGTKLEPIPQTGFRQILGFKLALQERGARFAWLKPLHTPTAQTLV
jgi:hypothetical protein